MDIYGVHHSYYLDTRTGNWLVAPTANIPQTWSRFYDSRGEWHFSPPFQHTAVAKLAFIGRGSGITYYLNSLGPEFDHGASVLFGIRDAWQPTVRGQGYINHEEHLINQWGRTVPRFSRTYLDRAAFARQNEAVIRRAQLQGLRVAEKEVRSITPKGQVFEIETKDRKYFLAANVVVGIGAGPHAGAEKLKIAVQNRREVKERVIDLDTFMRRYPQSDTGQHGTVIVYGPNAAIDAVERAREVGFDVIWFLGSKDPAFLPGNRLLYAPGVWDDRGNTVRRVDRESAVIELNDGISGGPLRVRFKTGKVPKVEYADLFVIGLGQDQFEEGAIGDVLLIKGGFTVENLEPRYDVNQRFGEVYETVLGLQVKGTNADTGVEIIGASAYNLARALQDERRTPVRHNFEEQFTAEEANASLYRALDLPQRNGRQRMERRERVRRAQRAVNQQRSYISRARVHLSDKTVVQSMEAIVGTTPQSVQTTDQLGAIRPAIAAMNGLMPLYIDHSVNLTTDDRTMLRVHLALKYPHIQERRRTPQPETLPIIDRIVRERRHRDRPLGYTDEETQDHENRLGLIDFIAQQRRR
jgi:hypothetical protein